jgi:hypothetical protein
MSVEQELIPATATISLDLPGLRTLSIEEFVDYFVAEIEKRDDVVDLVAEIQAIGQKVATCSVTSAEEFEASGGDLNTIRRLAKLSETKRMAITRPIDGLKKRVMAIFNPHERVLELADGEVSSALGKYSQEQRRRIAAAQAKADQEAREKREKLEAKAREEEAKGHTEKAEMLATRAAEVAAKPVAVVKAPTKAAGLKPRTEWKFEIVDASKLPEQYKTPNLVAIGQVVRALKQAADIPGVRVWEEDAFSAARK